LAPSGILERPRSTAQRSAGLRPGGYVLVEEGLEGGPHADRSGCLGRLEFRSVEVVDVRVVAAEVAQQGAGRLGVVAVEDRAPEGRQTGARAAAGLPLAGSPSRRPP